MSRGSLGGPPAAEGSASPASAGAAGAASRSLLAPLAVLGAAACGMVLFIYLTPPIFPASRLTAVPVMGTLSGDLGPYLWRFLMTALLLGVLPVGAALLAGYRPADLGLRLPAPRVPRLQWWLLVAAFLGAGVCGGLLPGTRDYYPYSRTILRWVAGGRLLWLPLHLLLYLTLYYIPWEALFRGALILPFARLVPLAGGRTGAPLKLSALLHGTPQAGLLLAVVGFQVIPSSMLHVGHPLAESLSAIPAGLAFGLVVLQTGSIWPAVFLHALAGFVTDILIIVRAVVAGG